MGVSRGGHLRQLAARAHENQFALVLAAAAALPLIVALRGTFTYPDSPVSDWALIELHVREVGGPHTPLVGPFSRSGWSHPGPLMFWLLAPLYRLFGSDGSAIYTGVTLLNIAGIVALVLIAARIGGKRLAMLATVAVLLMIRGEPEMFVDPWNPWLALVPCTVCLLAAIGAAEGDRRAMFQMVFFGSLSVQSHVGYGPTIAATCVTAIALHVTFPDRPDTSLSSRVQSVMSPTLFAVVLWSGPIIDLVVGPTRNLREIYRFFTEPTEATTGIGTAGRIAAEQLGPFGPWIGGSESDYALERPTLWMALPLLIGWTIAIVLATRARDRRGLRATIVTIAGATAGLLATSRITGILYSHVLRYWWAVAMIAWVVTGWVMLRRVATPRWLTLHRRLRLGGALTMTSVAVTFVTVTCMAVATESMTHRDEQRDLFMVWHAEALDSVQTELVADLEPGTTYRVEQSGPQLYFLFLAGIVNLLDRNDFTVTVDPQFESVYGPRWVPDGPDNSSTSVIDIVSPEPDGTFPHPDDAVLLVRFDDVSPDIEAAYESLLTKVETRLREAGREDLLVNVDTYLRTLIGDPRLAAGYGIDIDDLVQIAKLKTILAGYEVWLSPGG